MEKFKFADDALLSPPLRGCHRKATEEAGRVWRFWTVFSLFVETSTKFPVKSVENDGNWNRKNG